jgi:hypothetical protein
MPDHWVPAYAGTTVFFTTFTVIPAKTGIQNREAVGYLPLIR